MTPADCSELIAVIKDYFPTAKFSDNAPMAWAMLLGPYDKALVLGSMPAILKAHPDFPPSPGAIAKYIDNLTKPKIDGATAWQVAMDATQRCMNAQGGTSPTCCRRVIRGRLVQEQAEVVIRAGDAFGWEAILMAPLDRIEQSQRRFEKYLADAQQGSDRDEALVALGGSEVAIGE